VKRIWFLACMCVLLGLAGGCILSSSDRAEYRAIKRRLETYAPAALASFQGWKAGTVSDKEALSVLNLGYENYAKDYARKLAIEANETPWWKIAGIGLSWGLTIAGVFFGGRYPIINTLKSVVRGVETSGSKEVKAAIQTQAIRDGVEAGLHAIVKATTDA